MTEEPIFNGIDGATGGYLLSASTAQLADFALAEELDQDVVDAARHRVQSSEPTLALMEGIDPRALADAGWGVIFPQETDAAVEDALAELLQSREPAAKSADERRFQIYRGERGYHPLERKKQFLRQRGAAGSGPVNPDEMPYYLLLVGGPDKIPYAFQRELSIQYAVGRIDFETTLEYAQYARSVVTAEKGNPRPRQTVMFGVHNPDDRATGMSADLLVHPLYEHLGAWLKERTDQAPGYEMLEVLAQAATKDRLGTFLGGPATPAVLFSASHGLGFAKEHPSQRQLQGALVCQDWPGPEAAPPDVRRNVLPDKYLFGADDISDDARLLGLILFQFCCYGAGTPAWSEYPQLDPSRQPVDDLGAALARQIATEAFTAALPRRMLGHPKGGALAVIGHVERALSSSFAWQLGGLQHSSVTVFESAMRRLMNGYPVGAALDFFGQRYAEVSTELNEEIRAVKQRGHLPDSIELAGLWTQSADAGGFIILGDPAVRLAPASNSDVPLANTIAPVELRSDSGGLPDGTTRTVTAETTGQPVLPESPPRPPTPVRVEIEPQTGRITLTTGLQPGATAAPPQQDVSYLFGAGIGDAAAEIRAQVGDSLADLAGKLVAALKSLVEDVTTLQVATFVSSDLEHVAYDPTSRSFTGPVRQRALTSVRLDGMLVAVPEEAEQLEQHVWSAHLSMVEQAYSSRAEMIKAAAALVGIARPE